MKKLVMLSILLLSISNASICFAVGTPIQDGVIVPKSTMEHTVVGEGFYLTKDEATDVAQGIENLRAELITLEKQRDAYKEAYESQQDITSDYSKLLDDMYNKYEMQVNIVKELISLYEQKDVLRQKQLIEAKKELITHKSLNIVFVITILLML